MPGAKALEGQRFTRLLVISRVENDKHGQAKWECLCDCGNTCYPTTNNLRAGLSRSCGCLSKEKLILLNTKHGMSKTPEYQQWQTMISRCHNTRDQAYKDYGKRGITVSKEWRTNFLAFVEDMGPRPSPDHTLDRQDNDKGYSKENCRWATWEEQGNNRRNNVLYEMDGRTQTLAQWCRELRVPYGPVYMRILRGAAVAEAFAAYITKE